MASTQGADKLKGAAQDLVGALGHKAIESLGTHVDGLTERLEGIADGGPIGKAVAQGAESKEKGGSPVAGALKGAVSGVKDKITGSGSAGGKGGKATKATTIVEEIDIGLPLDVTYNQWTEFGSFPTFMKKVENVEAQEDNKLKWKAQIFWSHREWEATILEQIPDERIVWRSQGQKGHVDGSVTFHELGPTLTRVIVVLEYHPQGFMERTGNLWRAQGRRVHAELLHFRRHVMTRTVLDQDEVEGWRGTIEDGEVTESHEDAVAAEDEDYQDEDSEEPEASEDSEEEPEDEYAEPEDEYEEEPVDEEEDEEDYEEDEEDEEEPADEDEGEYEDDYEEPEEAEAPRRPTRSRRAG